MTSLKRVGRRDGWHFRLIYDLNSRRLMYNPHPYPLSTYPASRGFSLAWLLALTKSFAWLKTPVAKSKVAPMRYVRSKGPFSKKGIQKHPNANSHHLLSRSASCELADVIELNRAMKKRPVSAPSIIRLHSNSFDSSQPQNPSSILTVVATVHPQRPERHRNSLPIFHPSSLTKRWEAKRNHFNLSDPAGDLMKKQYQFNNRKLSNHLPYLLLRSPTARVRQSEIWVQDYHLERSTAYGKGTGSYGISLRSCKGLLKRSMSAPALREVSSFRNKTLQWEAPAACDESLDSHNL